MFVLKGDAKMARISIGEPYRGESGGAKYGVGGIVGAVMQEVMFHDIPMKSSYNKVMRD